MKMITLLRQWSVGWCDLLRHLFS